MECTRCGREVSVEGGYQHLGETLLRHCELVKGHREGNSIYLVPFDCAE